MRASFLLIAVVLAALPIGAQRAGAPPQFTARTDLVRVDVSVLDRDRQPVRDLTAADFTVRENGTPQPIEAFTAVDLPVPAGDPTAWPDAIASDVRRNDEHASRRLLVLVLDDAMVPADPQMAKSVRQIARRAVERLGPADMAAVVFTIDRRHVQGFTHDRARLLSAIDAFQPAAGDAGLPYAVASIETLGRLTDLLASVPDRRKTVLWVSIGLPMDPAQAGDRGTPSGEIFARLTRLLRQAQRASVNIYAVDPGGLDGLLFRMKQRQRLQILDSSYYENLARHYRSFLQTIADNTGGHAFVNTNELDSRVDQILRETGSFYLLGYRSSRPDADGRFRRIEVSVSRPDVTVRTRRGYYAPESGRTDDSAAAPVDAALAGLLPRGDLPLQMVAAPFSVPGQPTPAVAVVVGLPSPDSGSEGAASSRVDLRVSAFTPAGEPRGSTRLGGQVAAGPDAAGGAGYELLSLLHLPPGRYELRIAASAGLTEQKTGSVYYDIEVPDFARAPLSLSGVALSTTPAAPAAPREAFAAFLPATATTRRTFARTDVVRAFVQVHQSRENAGVATVRVAVVNRGEATVFATDETFPAERFVETGNAGYTVDLPIATLDPGEYLLAIEASRGDLRDRRTVRFEVR